MPKYGAKKHRRQSLIRSNSVVIEGAIGQKTFSYQDPRVASLKNGGCPLGYSVVCFAKRRLVIRLSTSEVPLHV